jgi:hypothetical protein
VARIWCRLRARDAEDGLTIIEVVLASFILLLVAVNVFAAMGTGQRVLATARKRQTAMFWMNHLMEVARNTNYANLGLTSADSAASAITAWKATAAADSTGTDPDRLLTGDGSSASPFSYNGEALVLNGQCAPDNPTCATSQQVTGTINHRDDSGPLGTEGGTYEGWTLVTWSPYTLDGATRYYKRVTTVVRWVPYIGGLQRTVQASSFFSVGYVPTASGSGAITTTTAGAPAVTGCVAAAAASQPDPTHLDVGLTATASGGVTISGYEWSFGDGSANATTATAYNSHAYARGATDVGYTPQVRALAGSTAGAWLACTAVTVPAVGSPTGGTTSCPSVSGDVTPPTVQSTTLGGGGGYARSPQVTLTATATDAGGMASLAVSTAGATSGYGAPIPYGSAAAASTTVDLGATPQGTRSVWVKFTDCSGNTSAPRQVSIFLDTVPPDAPTLDQGNGVKGQDDCITVSWSAGTDPGGSAASGVAYYYVYRTDHGTTTRLPVTGSPPTRSPYIDYVTDTSTNYSYKVTAVDNAGNESAASNAGADAPKSNGTGC